MANQPTLPEKQKSFKLNEVCKVANVQPYMLRFWGTEFSQLEAEKSGTGQRLYSREQVELILEIRRLLFDEGLTIAGARKRVSAIEEAGGVAEAGVTEGKEKAAKKQSGKATSQVRTSSARKSVDKTVREHVKPLLATLKDVRSEVAKILEELESG